MHYFLTVNKKQQCFRSESNKNKNKEREREKEFYQTFSVKKQLKIIFIALYGDVI